MADIDIEKTLAQLSLNEKIGLLAGIDFWHTFPVERLGVPSLRFSDGPNGVRGTKFFNAVPSACFPCGSGLAATFNKDLLLKAGALMAEEAKHKSAHVILGPTTNMARGPLGGRAFESFSEDPYLAGMASASIVKGIQDGDIAATIKHFVGNDLEHERNSSDSVMTQRALREIYLEPFRLAVKYADPKAFMTGYNKVNGEHVSQSRRILQEILREEWGWDGTIMSDWFGTYTSKVSIENGLDIEMPGPPRLRTLEAVTHQIQSRELHANNLDERVRGVLKLVKATAKAGIAENGPETSDNNTAETSAFLRKIGSEGIVLLKNEDSILPLKKTDKIAVIGPNAKMSASSGGGSASLTAYYKTTPYEGILAKLSSPPDYTVGAYGHKGLPDLGQHLINPATKKTGLNMKFYAKDPSDKANAGQEHFDEINTNNAYIILFDYKSPIDTNLYYVVLEGDYTPEETATYEFGLTNLGTSQLFVDGKPVVDNKTKQTPGDSFFGLGTVEEKGTIELQKGKTYRISIEFGSGPTSLIFGDDAVNFGGGGAVCAGVAKVIDPQEEIKKAAELAASVDKVVLSIGLNQEWETEGRDRPDMDLPGYTNELVSAILDANPNTVVVNQSGTPVEMPWLPKAKALVQAWYGGNELGNAIADVLFGDVNPSGKLSLSWPFKLVDNPTYLNFKTERGRVLYGEDIYIGYRYYEKLQRRVAFPFGFGLSYTEFAYSGLKVSVDESKDLLEASIKVKNTGAVDGAEVVQVYISSKQTTVTRPVKELKEFAKVFLKAGEEKTVDFKLSLKDAASYFDEYEDKWSLEAGDYEVLVGKSSDDIEEIAPFKVATSKLWLGI